MTQKELLYFEDAIGHESNMIKVLNETVTNMQDENLISFLNCEIEKHQDRKNKLMNVLEDKSNE